MSFPIEVIFVDDSTDNTPEVVQEADQHYCFDVSVIARPPERRNGLGMAVVEGIHAAKSKWVCVMDGDLQHPPELIPKMLAKAEENGLDLVAGSRLAAGGDASSLGLRRYIISQVLALGSRTLFYSKLRKISDPLTGFFVFQRSKVDASKLHPDGFKILLDILIRSKKLNISEVPFVFGERYAGESKASTKEAMRLFRHLAQLRMLAFQNMYRFLIVGATGLLVNNALVALFTEFFGVHYLWSAVLATQGSTLWNFGLTETWVFGDREQDNSLRGRFAGFFLMNNGMLLLRGPMISAMVTWLGMHYLLANFLSLVLMTLIRFGLADRFIWKKKDQPKTNSAVTDEGGLSMTQPQAYYYNIHDLIRIRSEQRLPELGYFMTLDLDGFDKPDIDVHLCSQPQEFRRDDSIEYQESVGRYGFGIVINRGEELTEIYATPLIGRSPHVLYTNVVEPLLRWHFVRKGYALMHGACLSFNGNAVFITAQTDTGKTTTILFTMRHNIQDAGFLSDDMTIFGKDGSVMCYPKPLTISAHTLQAVGVSPLSFKERAFLQVQSRLHSRSGRWFGMILNTLRAPAATMNAIVQWIIPPPKFMVDHLLPKAIYVNKAELSQIVLIERGENYEGEIPESERVAMLIANAEDAYGFPPYPILADQLSHWHGKDLHEAERALVQEAIAGLPATHIRRSDYGWYKRIPQLVKNMVKQEMPASSPPIFTPNAVPTD